MSELCKRVNSPLICQKNEQEVCCNFYPDIGLRYKSEYATNLASMQPVSRFQIKSAHLQIISRLCNKFSSSQTIIETRNATIG